MKNAKIVLVAQWDGWCGACAADRPLVLTRTGRQRLRTWLTGAADDSRPLVLTCRLCGTGVDVPLERDDPPVELAVEVHEPTPAADAALEAHQVAAGAAAPPEAAGTTTATAAELTAGRQAVAQALAGLMAQRRAAATVAQPTPVPEAVAVPLVAPVPVLPLQRNASTGGLTELQLLADGIDLLSTGRT